MRSYKTFDDLIEQAEYFVDAVSNYKSDFVMFPEFFNAPLVAAYNHLPVTKAIRELAKCTIQIRDKFSELAISYNINIITGSMPLIREDGHLYNIGYLCRRDGSFEAYEKLHVTPNEAKVYGMIGGSKIQTFGTDCRKIGVLICYDVEFPELGRLLANEGMNILLVPFLTVTLVCVIVQEQEQSKTSVMWRLLPVSVTYRRFIIWIFNSVKQSYLHLVILHFRQMESR